MLKYLLKNKPFMGTLIFCLLIVVGSSLYLSHVKRQTAEDLAHTRELRKQWEETQQQQQTQTQAPVEDTSQGGHTHADGTWHPGPHDQGSHQATPSRQTIRPQMVSPIRVSGQSSKDTGEWKVLWPPPIPGLGQHSPVTLKPIPEAFIRAYLVMSDDLDSSDLSPEEKERTRLGFYADYWGVDPDDPEALVGTMQDFGKAFPEVLNTLPPERAYEVAREFDRSPHLSGKAISVKTYAEAALAVNPNNINARHTLAKTIADYDAILKIDPNNHLAMWKIGNAIFYDRPEEAIPIFEKAVDLGSTSAYAGLGHAYERLGDYKTAWMYHYKFVEQVGSHAHSTSLNHMAAIVRGEPVWGTIRRASDTEVVPDVGSDGAPSGSFATVSDTETPTVDTAPRPVDLAGESEDVGRSEAAAAAAREAAAAAKAQQQQIQQEIEEFIHWLEQAHNETPEAENFLSQEMKKHLQNTTPAAFSPERLIRAQETLERYGPEDGLRRLETVDPEIADHLRRNPPRRGASPPRPRK